MDGVSATTLVSVSSALVGTVLGSVITAAVNARVARANRREKACQALWDYHYALAGYAASIVADPDCEPETMLQSKWQSVVNALRVAYPYAGQLSSRAQRTLFRTPYRFQAFDPDGNWYNEIDRDRDHYEWRARLLEAELRAAFPQRLGDRLRGIWRRHAIGGAPK